MSESNVMTGWVSRLPRDENIQHGLPKKMLVANLFGPHSWYFATGPWKKNWKRPSSALSRSAGFTAINSCAMPYKTNDTGKNVWEPVEPVYSCLTMQTMRLNGTRIPDSLLRVEFRTLQEHYNSIGVQSEPFPACMASHPDLKTKTHYFHVTTMCIYGVEKNEKTQSNSSSWRYYYVPVYTFTRHMVELICSWVQRTLLTDAKDHFVRTLAHFVTACVEIDVKHMESFRSFWVLETKNIGFTYRAHVPQLHCSQVTITLFCNIRVGFRVLRFQSSKSVPVSGLGK